MTLHELLRNADNWTPEQIIELYNTQELRLNYALLQHPEHPNILDGVWGANPEHEERYPYCLAWWQNYAWSTAQERRLYPEERYPTFDIPWNTSGCLDPDMCGADTQHYLHETTVPPEEIPEDEEEI